MPKQNLPTDEEYLDSYFQVPANYINPVLNDPQLMAEMIEDMKNGGLVPPGEDPREFAIKFFDPKESFRGIKTRILTDAARQTLPADLHYLLDIPFGFRFLENLNGFAAPTPRGGSIIVLNLGVSLHLNLLGRCILIMTNWDNVKHLCADRQPVDYVNAMIHLGRFACTLNEQHLQQVRIWRYPPGKDYELKSAKLAVLIEEFVLLHEYGHVACGHTKHQKTETRFGLTMYSQRHEQEYEADAFAFKHLEARYGNEAAVLAATSLFRYFDLMEHLQNGKSTTTSTHPAGRKRLQAIQSSYILSDKGKQISAQIEDLFDVALGERHNVANVTSRKFL